MPEDQVPARQQGRRSLRCRTWTSPKRTWRDCIPGSWHHRKNHYTTWCETSTIRCTSTVSAWRRSCRSKPTSRAASGTQRTQPAQYALLHGGRLLGRLPRTLLHERCLLGGLDDCGGASPAALWMRARPCRPPAGGVRRNILRRASLQRWRRAPATTERLSLIHL